MKQLPPRNACGDYENKRLHLLTIFRKETHLFSITGTSTACKVFGLNREPGFKAPHPAAQPNLPRKSSFFSGRQMGAEILLKYFLFGI